MLACFQTNALLTRKMAILYLESRYYIAYSGREAGLVVMVGETYSRVRKFESQHQMLDGLFSTSQSQCDQIARLFIVYLAIYNNENLLNSR